MNTVHLFIYEEGILTKSEACGMMNKKAINC